MHRAVILVLQTASLRQVKTLLATFEEHLSHRQIRDPRSYLRTLLDQMTDGRPSCALPHATADASAGHVTTLLGIDCQLQTWPVALAQTSTALLIRHSKARYTCSFCRWFSPDWRNMVAQSSGLLRQPAEYPCGLPERACGRLILRVQAERAPLQDPRRRRGRRRGPAPFRRWPASYA